MPLLRAPSNHDLASRPSAVNSIDRKTARELLSQHGDKITAIDTKLAQLQSEIDELARARRELMLSRHEAEEVVQRCYLTLSYSGVADLPTEILSEIFQHLINDTEDLVNKSAAIGCATELIEVFPVAYDPLTAICGVCTHWRNVAFQNPRLWTRVGVSIDNSALSAHYDVNPLKRWLGRSCSLPLQVKVQWNYYAKQRKAPVSLMKELFSSFSRWETLNFCNPYKSRKPFPDLPAGMIAAKLHTIKFDFGAWSTTPDDIEWAQSILNAAPTLDTLFWTGPVSVFQTESFSCTSLRSLTIIDRDGLLDEYAILYLLSVLPLLEILNASFDQSESDLDFAVPHDPVHHAHIRVLNIYNIYTVDALFEMCCLPALTELGIFCTKTNWIQSSFMHFLSRSAPKLTSFAMHATQITAEELRECFEHPSIRDTLTTLDVNVSRDDDAPTEILQDLTPYPDVALRLSASPTTPRLPKLERLAIRLSSHAEIHSLTTLLRARWIKSQTVATDIPPVAVSYADLKSLEIDVQFLQRVRPDSDPIISVELTEAFDILAAQGVTFANTGTSEHYRLLLETYRAV